MAAGAAIRRLDLGRPAWSASAMVLTLDRRIFLGGAGVSLASVVGARAALARKSLALELVAAELELRPEQRTSKVWRFAGKTPRFVQGDEVDVTVTNRLPVPVMIGWRGLDGHPALEPFLARGPIAPDASGNYALSLRHAGTLLCDARLLPGALPLPVLPFVVSEAGGAAAQDETLLIEDWRLRADGSVLPPGREAEGAMTLYTVNGSLEVKLAAQAGQNLRLRLINGAQRHVLAIEFSNADIRVIAIDGQPSEPFPAREGRLVMAPGTRIDAIVALTGAACTITVNDGAQTVTIGDISGQPTVATAAPLPSNGLPDKLPLQTALRVNLDLAGNDGWLPADSIFAKAVPAFRVARNRTVVLALVNPSDNTAIFHLHGHHMRLLDRLDDGWKPFWLDTVAVPSRQTVRVAFGATNPGAYLMEMTRTAWSSTRTFRSYLVEG